MTYDNTNTFIFSRNERKSEDKHPDFTGTLNVDGVEYFMDAWVREKKDGSGRFFSGRIKPKNAQRSQASEPDRAERFRKAVRDNFGSNDHDDIPF